MQDTAFDPVLCRDRADAARREAEEAAAPDIREQWLDLARHWERLAHNVRPPDLKSAGPRGTLALEDEGALRKSRAKPNGRPATTTQDRIMQEPTPEDAARHILRVFVAEFNRRPFDVLLVDSFEGPFAAAPWRPADFNRGLDHARRQGWIEANGPVLTLTDLGYAAT
ncbi:MAG: hypothetical protein JWL84_1590 [Rhodospirillales bacterium]|jgi:hypothetical protein|nr:hypothetical protein [Rhodospirillales bacterium]